MSNKEEYFVSATLTYKGNEHCNVPCKVYLPERINGKPQVILKPTSRVARVLSSCWQLALKSDVIGLDGNKEASIKIPELNVSNSEINYWGKDISESNIYCEPENLELISPFKMDDFIGDTVVSFWISDNPFITPLVRSLKSYDGSIKKKPVHEVVHNIAGDDYEFLERFKYKNEDNGDLTQWSYLVAECKTSIEADKTEEIKEKYLERLDDFLLLTSLASRQSTACLGWEAYDRECQVKYYRGNYSFPDITETGLNNSLIDKPDFIDFIKVTQDSFNNYENILALRSSIYSIIRMKGRSVESSFLSLFSGLETLILEFRRIQGFEFILEDTEWLRLKKGIEKFIKKSEEPKLNSKNRSRIYSKLNELNRVSLREAYELFCLHYDIPSHDLWPLFGSKTQAGLTDIRNRIAHGDPFPDSSIDSLINANFQLSIFLERSILRVLDWDLNKSNVNPETLKIYAPSILEFDENSRNIKRFLL